MAPLSIMGHSMGGFVSTLYTGLYPGTVSKLVVVDGIVIMPDDMRTRLGAPYHERLGKWIDEVHGLSARNVKKYTSIEEAVARMHTENPRLSPEQARSLTVHGVNQNEDGTYSWKFDNYVRANAPYDMTTADIEGLWARITCPTLLVYGKESWASNPEKDGRLKNFKTAKVVEFDNAGHWVHHDRLDAFVDTVRAFIA
jgi:pimeloyl-ACP methyl ester carboxylesterase